MERETIELKAAALRFGGTDPPDQRGRRAIR